MSWATIARWSRSAKSNVRIFWAFESDYNLQIVTTQSVKGIILSKFIFYFELNSFLEDTLNEEQR